MKKGIHPTLYTVEIKCSTCGKVHTVKSTVKEFTVDVCSGCHPFYTGNTQAIKSTGRVERFNRRFEASNQK